jgi:hypothetical protein
VVPPYLLVKPSLPIALADIPYESTSPRALLDGPFVKLGIDERSPLFVELAMLVTSI